MDTSFKTCKKCNVYINDGELCEKCQNESQQNPNMKYCKFCGRQVVMDAVICVHCGRQIEQIEYVGGNQNQVPVNVYNTNTNSNSNTNTFVVGRAKNKWVALFLCLFLGYFGAHKFYEGRTLMGVIYLFTVGLFFVGVVVDCIALLFKPNPYYV